MKLTKRSEDWWFAVNLALIIAGAMVVGVVLYLRDHLEWSWH